MNFSWHFSRTQKEGSSVSIKMTQEKPVLGLIAGGGSFPLKVAEAAQKMGYSVHSVAHHGETDPALADYVDGITWIRLGQLGRLIKALKKAGAARAVMAGTITKKRMFENVRPDVRGLAIATKLAIFHDDDILRAVAADLASEGIVIISPTDFLPDIVAAAGLLTKKRPSGSQKDDISFGWMIAKELGRLDIGQCVVVRDKTVLALEAIEGTDETIRRGGRLAREKAVVVKVCKPRQDKRFDLPTVGVNTINVMAEVKASVLAIEAGRTIIFDKDEMIREADRLGMVITALDGERI